MGETTTYTSYKWTVFVSMYIGYTIMFLNRKSFSFAMPVIIDEQGLDKDDLGLIMSSQLLAYSVSKFLGGIATDIFSPRLLFCSALSLSGVTVIVFTMFQDKLVYALLWFVLGFVQGGGWPSCGKILRKWVSPEEFGTFWSILSTGMNVASSVGPIVTTVLIVHSGWRPALQIYGTMALGMTAVCLFTISDSPESVGLVAPHEMNKKVERGKPRGRGRGSWGDMMKSPLMWLMGLSYLVVLMTRCAVQDWAQLYLIKNRNQTHYAACAFISSLEVGGIIGSISAGFLGDKAVSMTQRDNTRGSPRMYVVMAFLSIAFVSLHLIIFTITPDSSQMWISLVGFVFGFGIYGPIAVYGVMAIESAPAHLSGTSHAIVGLFANIGGVMAGLPFSILAEWYDWPGAFFFLEVVIGCVLLTKLLGRNIEYKMIPTKKKLQ